MQINPGTGLRNQLISPGKRLVLLPDPIKNWLEKGIRQIRSRH